MKAGVAATMCECFCHLKDKRAADILADGKPHKPREFTTKQHRHDIQLMLERGQVELTRDMQVKLASQRGDNA